MGIVVSLSLIVEDHTLGVMVLLVIQARLGQIWPIATGSKFVDWNEGWLHDHRLRPAVRIMRVGVLRDLDTVRDVVPIGISIERVRPGVADADESSRVGFHAIKEAVSIGIGIERVGPGDFFSAVIEPVIVSIGYRGISAISILLGVVHAVLVKVSRPKLGQVSGKELLFVSVRDTVSIGIDVWIKAIEVGPPALAVGVGVKFRRRATADAKGPDIANTAKICSVGGEIVVVAETNICCRLRASTVLHQPDIDIEPASSTFGRKVEVTKGPGIPAHVIVLKGNACAL